MKVRIQSLTAQNQAQQAMLLANAEVAVTAATTITALTARAEAAEKKLALAEADLERSLTEPEPVSDAGPAAFEFMENSRGGGRTFNPDTRLMVMQLVLYSFCGALLHSAMLIHVLCCDVLCGAVPGAAWSGCPADDKRHQRCSRTSNRPASGVATAEQGNNPQHYR